LSTELEDGYEESFCYPIVIHCGSQARIDFKNPSILHHFTSSEHEEFDYLVKIFCSHRVGDLLNEKKMFFVSIYVYNYVDFDFRADIIRDFVFFPDEIQAAKAAAVIPSFFKPHIHHALVFTGEDKYEFSDFRDLAEKWKKENLDS